MKHFFVLVIFLFGLMACSDKWTGFYYPYKSNLSRHIKSPEFKSLEECRAWVSDQIYTYNPSGENYDYECGKNCKYSDEYHMQTCKETIK